MTTHDLHCSHVAGTDELIDALGDGALTAEWQEKAARLIRARVYPGAPVVEGDYRGSEVLDYETADQGDGYFSESWTCPDCGQHHEDTREVQS
jgi:hypothetical protein